MATNILTPELDLLTREFFQKVANDTSLYPSNPVLQRNMCNTIMMLLNYDYVQGCFVERTDKSPQYGYMGKQEAVCEWEADTKRAMEALDEANKGTSTDQADSSEPTTDSEIRETVLREDV
jgi:hypothetical protein